MLWKFKVRSSEIQVTRLNAFIIAQPVKNIGYFSRVYYLPNFYPRWFNSMDMRLVHPPGGTLECDRKNREYWYNVGRQTVPTSATAQRVQSKALCGWVVQFFTIHHHHHHQPTGSVDRLTQWVEWNISVPFWGSQRPIATTAPAQRAKQSTYFSR